MCNYSGESYLFVVKMAKPKSGKISFKFVPTLNLRVRKICPFHVINFLTINAVEACMRRSLRNWLFLFSRKFSVSVSGFQNIEAL